MLSFPCYTIKLSLFHEERSHFPVALSKLSIFHEECSHFPVAHIGLICVNTLELRMLRICMPRKGVSGYGKMILMLANQSGSLTRYLPESSLTRPRWEAYSERKRGWPSLPHSLRDTKQIITVQLNYRQFLPKYGYSLRKSFCETKVGEFVDQSVNLIYPDKQRVYADWIRFTAF